MKARTWIVLMLVLCMLGLSAAMADGGVTCPNCGTVTEGSFCSECGAGVAASVPVLPHPGQSLTDAAEAGKSPISFTHEYTDEEMEAVKLLIELEAQMYPYQGDPAAALQAMQYMFDAKTVNLCYGYTQHPDEWAERYGNALRQAGWTPVFSCRTDVGVFTCRGHAVMFFPADGIYVIYVDTSLTFGAVVQQAEGVAAVPAAVSAGDTVPGSGTVSRPAATSAPASLIDDDCKYCDGTGDCSHCYGMGIYDCDNCIMGDCKACGGEGYIESWSGGKIKSRNCSSCNSSGRCRKCNGEGEISCRYCSGSGDCSYCRGSGKR